MAAVLWKHLENGVVTGAPPAFPVLVQSVQYEDSRIVVTYAPAGM